jgi:uncharacterized phage-associated protein
MVSRPVKLILWYSCCNFAITKRLNPVQMKTNVLDVSAYILSKIGPITTMKLQKLIYYCQAWSLVWDDTPMFEDKIEAWTNGPVCPSLYNAHKGEYLITKINGSIKKLNKTQIETVDKILDTYGVKNSKWLIDLTHLEDPWINSRKGLVSTERGNTEITLACMAEYYSSL